jgi:hypothetical protein
VVVDAVEYEPVSARDSLITRKIQGISLVLTLRFQRQHLIVEWSQRLAAQFPAQRSREIFLRNREMEMIEQRIDADERICGS